MKLNFISLLMFFPLVDYAASFTGELTKTAVDALTLSKASDFTATLTYYVPERVGPNVTAGSELYMMRAVTVDANDLLRSCSRFLDDVRAGRAYTTAS